VVHQPGEARAQYSWMDHSLRSLASPVRTALSTLGISSRDSYTFKAFSTGGKETDIEGLPCCNNWPRRLSLYPTAEWEQYWWRQAEGSKYLVEFKSQADRDKELARYNKRLANIILKRIAKKLL
jgi:hypothetical protein